MSDRLWRAPCRIPLPTPPAEAALRPAPSWRAAPPSFRPVALEARNRNLRAHEGPGASSRLVAVGHDQPRFADEHPPFAADPPPFGDDRARLERPSENEIERRRQKEAVADQGIAGV